MGKSKKRVLMRQVITGSGREVLEELQ